MLSAQNMSDRLEIQDLLVRYCDAIDERDFDALDDVFLADAFIDYTEAGGAKGTLPEIKTYLARALGQFSKCQHMIGLPRIKIEGDTATARTTLYNPMVLEYNGAPHTFFVGMWYCDELVRTDKGWRIKTRSEEACYFHNLPENFQPVE